MYYPKEYPTNATPDEVAQFVYQELQQLSALLQSLQVPWMTLAELHVAPTKPRDGMVLFADGTDWNPGGGRGVYVYSSSAWVKL